jgi:O-antigen ligase
MNRIFIAAGVAVYVLVMIISIIEFPWPVTAVLAVLPALATTVSSRALFLLMPFATLHAAMFVPGLPGNFQIYQVFCILFIGYSIVTFAITKEQVPNPARMDRMCALFLIGWIVALMFARGSGMRILGSNQIGGATYLQALVALGFYLETRTSAAPLRDLRRAGIALGLLGLLPLLANGLFELSGGRIWQQMLFFKWGAAFGETASAVTEGMATRLSFLSYGVPLLWVGVFLAKPGKGIGGAKLFWWPLALLFSLLAGYRAVMISTALFFGLYGLIVSRRRSIYLVGGLAFVALAYIALMVVARDLPFPIQRLLSSFPGMDVSWEARAHAMGTVYWRKEVWAYALNDFSQYWLFGRGLTFNPDMIPMLDRFRNDPYVAFVTGNFHHATLELLVLYGIPAFLATLLFYASALRNGLSTFTRNRWHDPQLREWGLAILLFAAVRSTLSFLAGTSAELLVGLPIWLALFNIIRNTDIQRARAALAESAPDENRRYPG